MRAPPLSSPPSRCSWPRRRRTPHQGSPNFLSQVDRVTPTTDGVTVSVLNRDDQLLLHNTSGRTSSSRATWTSRTRGSTPTAPSSVNTDSQAYYINQERDGKVDVPAGADSKGAPRWKEVSRLGSLRMA